MNEIRRFLPSIPQFTAIAHGTASGLWFGEISRVVKASDASLAKVIFQMFEGDYALTYARHALEVSGRMRPSSMQRWSIHLAPAVLAIAINSLDWKNPTQETIRVALRHLQNSLVPLYRVAILVSCVALFYFGHTLFAVSSLAGLSTELLDANSPYTSAFKTAVYGASLVSSVLNRQVLDFLFNGAFALYNYNSCLKAKNARPIPQEGALTADALKQDTSSFKLRADALTDFPRPTVPDLTSDSLGFLESKTLRASYGERFDGLIAHARNKMSQLEPGSKLTDPMFGYLELMIQHVRRQKEAGAPNWDEGLFALAETLGTYTGPKDFCISQEIEDAYCSIRYRLPGQTIRSKILFALENARKSQLRSISTDENGLLLYQYHSFANFFHDVFRLNSPSADQDFRAPFQSLSGSFRSILSEYLDEYSQVPALQRELSSLEFIKKSVSNAIFNGDISRKEIAKWWGEWINKQPLSDEEKKKLSRELSLHQLKKDIWISDKVIYGMLLDMGILEISSQPTAVESSTGSLDEDERDLEEESARLEALRQSMEARGAFAAPRAGNAPPFGAGLWDPSDSF